MAIRREIEFGTHIGWWYMVKTDVSLEIKAN